MVAKDMPTAPEGAGRSIGHLKLLSVDLTRSCAMDTEPATLTEADPPKRGRDLEDGKFLRHLKALQAHMRFEAALFTGGEPLLRPKLLAEAIDIFDHNAVLTSGVLPIPTTLQAGILVVLDGEKSIHDALRGKGTYDAVVGNLRRYPRDKALLYVTLTTANQDAAEHLPALVEHTGARGALVNFYAGQPGDPLLLEHTERDQVINGLLAMIEEKPGVLLNPPGSLELLRTHQHGELSGHCVFQYGGLAVDEHLEVKDPCTYGECGACESCGLAVAAMYAASALGDRLSKAVLDVIFPPRIKARSLPVNQKAGHRADAEPTMVVQRQEATALDASALNSFPTELNSNTDED
jgi:hypothetical protein